MIHIIIKLSYHIISYLSMYMSIYRVYSIYSIYPDIGYISDMWYMWDIRVYVGYGGSIGFITWWGICPLFDNKSPSATYMGIFPAKPEISDIHGAG